MWKIEKKQTQMNQKKTNKCHKSQRKKEKKKDRNVKKNPKKTSFIMHYQLYLLAHTIDDLQIFGV